MSFNKENSFYDFWNKVCVITIWVTVLYSNVIQHKFFQIPHGMLLLGLIIIMSFIFIHNNRTIDPNIILTRESVGLICFMAYMLLIGLVISPDIKSHISQWITSLEYMFIMIVISSLILSSGTESFHLLLLFDAIILAIIFLINPVYISGGRYSISTQTNPNGLGMSFTSGIWASLYLVHKRKIPTIICLSFVGLFVYCMFFTGSRKAFIAACLIIGLWILFIFIPDLNQKNILHSIFIVFSVIIAINLLGNIFLNFYTNSAISERMGNLLHEVTDSNRARMYRDGLILFKQNPLFGFGFQGFKNFYGGYSHATLVEIPVSCGIIGTIFYMLPYLISLKKCFTLFFVTKDNNALFLENEKIKYLLILWIVMLFYCSCIIHHYQFESFIIFGIIFGQSSYLEKTIIVQKSYSEKLSKKWKYIKL